MAKEAFKDKERTVLFSAEKLTSADRGKTFYCPCCGAPMWPVVFDLEPHLSYFASDKHSETCLLAKRSKNKVEETDVCTINIDNMLEEDNGESSKGGDGGPKGPDGDPDIDPHNTTRPNIIGKDKVISSAGTMLKYFRDKNLLQVVDGYKVDDLVFDERNIRNKLRTPAMEGVHLILVKRCFPKDVPFEIPKGFACFKDIVTNNPKQASYFLVRLGNLEKHKKFTQSAFSKDTKEKYKYIGVFGNWKKMDVSYPYVYYVENIKKKCVCFIKD